MISESNTVVSIAVHQAIIELGPEKGKRVFQATVTWKGHGVVAEPQGDSIPELLYRVAAAVDAAGKAYS